MSIKAGTYLKRMARPEVTMHLTNLVVLSMTTAALLWFGVAVASHSID